MSSRMSAAAAAALVDAAYEGLHGEDDLHAEQLLWALCAQLRACPELADCSDLGVYLVKKYAPAAARSGKLEPVKNKRFAELARVVALAPRALLEEFEPEAMAAGESDDESVDDDGLPAYLTPEGIWSALADELDSDDESGCAQMLRFAAKLDSFGIPLYED